MLQALFAGVLGIWCYFLGLHVYAVAAQQHRWYSTWSRRLPALRRSTVGAEPGEVLCVEGRCGPPVGPALVCPVFRASCVAFWLWVHSGMLGHVRYRRSQAVRFWLERTAGHAEEERRILVDPAAVGLVELDRALDTRRDGNSRHDPEFERHLENRAMENGRASSLGVLHGRLEPGQPCTVIGPLMHAEAGASPYRHPLVPMIGGAGPVYIATTTRDGLLRRLRWQRALAEAIMVVAGVMLGGGAALIGAALLREPWLSFVGVPVLIGMAGARGK